MTPAEHGEDRDWMARVRDGDLEALGALYDKYRLPVFHTALAITRDHAVAEDILQECFLRLNAHAARIDATLPLLPWLYRVTVNLSYSYVSRDARRKVSLEGLIDHFEQFVAPAGHAPEAQAERRDLESCVRDAVQALPFHQRAVVVLYYVGGLDLKEIAYILDCPVGTVKSRLHSSREALRKQLVGSLEPQTARTLGVVYDYV